MSIPRSYQYSPATANKLIHRKMSCHKSLDLSFDLSTLIRRSGFVLCMRLSDFTFLICTQLCSTATKEIIYLLSREGCCPPDHSISRPGVLRDYFMCMDLVHNMVTNLAPDLVSVEVPDLVRYLVPHMVPDMGPYLMPALVPDQSTTQGTRSGTRYATRYGTRRGTRYGTRSGTRSNQIWYHI